VESSALLAGLLERSAGALAALEAPGTYVTSALTLAEASRAIVRARASGRLSPAHERAAVMALRQFEEHAGVLDVTADILERAGRPFPVEPVRTLDAIHLATIETIGEPPPLLTVITRDARVRDNAVALGYAVEG
jgi:predicted nucleic acid-binding protein